MLQIIVKIIFTMTVSKKIEEDFFSLLSGGIAISYLNVESEPKIATIAVKIAKMPKSSGLNNLVIIGAVDIIMICANTVPDINWVVFIKKLLPVNNVESLIFIFSRRGTFEFF